MSKNSIISSYLLKFDFSKKVVFILSFAIFSAIFLIINILITYNGLTNLLQKQISGLEYHAKLTSNFNLLTQLQARLTTASMKNRNELEAKLITNNFLFLSIIKEIKNLVYKLPAENQLFYLGQLEKFEKKFEADIISIYQDEMSKHLDDKELRGLLEKLKKHLIAFSAIIIDLFDLKLYFNPVDRARFNFILHYLPSYQNAVSQLLSISIDPLTTKIEGEIDFYQSLIEENLKDLFRESHALIQGEQQLTLSSLMKNFLSNTMKLSNLLSSQTDQEIVKEAAWNDIQKTGLKTLQQSRKLYQMILTALRNSLFERYQTFINRQIITTLLGLIGIFLVLTPYLVKAFRRPLSDIEKAITKLTQGDLSVRIPAIHSNEVGAVSKSFNETAKIFEEIMHETEKFAIHLSVCSSDIFSTVSTQEQNLSKQEATILAITKHSKNILKTVQDFSTNLISVDNTIRQTAQQVSLSRDSLSDLETMMQHMSSSAQSTVSALSSIKSAIDKITIVINTLVTIADQINLLSLNTAIRAGKAGLKKLGFTVIADKIRELADRTAFVTLDMEEMVHQMLSIVPQIISNVDQFSQEIKEALTDSVVVREQFQHLLNMTQNQISTFQTIHQGMQDQAEKTADIDKAINELSLSNQQTLQSVENLSEEIKSLHLSTKNLLDKTNHFVKTPKQTLVL